MKFFVFWAGKQIYGNKGGTFPSLYDESVESPEQGSETFLPGCTIRLTCRVNSLYIEGRSDRTLSG